MLYRCKCNAVSSPKIATHAGDFKSMKFHQDPTNPKEMICDDCFKALQEVNEDWLDAEEDQDLFWSDFDDDWDEEEHEDDADED